MTTQIAIDPASMIAFLLAGTRAAAWVFIAPPFGQQLSVRVRTGIAFSLALVMAPTAELETLPSDTASLAAAALTQIFIGAALGFAVYFFFAVFTAAGSIIDFSAGLTASSMYDPATGSQNTVFGRAYYLFATVLLFASGGHLLLIDGFLRTFKSAPMTAPTFSAVGEMFTSQLGWFAVSALQIALPVGAALFLTELALGLVARAAPQTNVLTLGFALKSGVALATVAVSVSLLPAFVSRVTDHTVSVLF